MLICLAALVVFSGIICQAEEEYFVEITALNVGKADALVVRVGEKTYLIDSGLKKRFDTLLADLKEMGIDHLDGVFLTHTDKDHGGGLKKLAKTDIGIDAFYAAELYFEKDDEDHQALKAAEERGMAVSWLKAGDSVAVDDQSRFEVLGPLLMDKSCENNNSLVLRLTTPEGNALFTGDMECDAEALLLQSGCDLSACYLKIAHHGREDATSLALVGAVCPEIAVISTDSVEEPDSRSDMVVERLEDAGAAVYVTEDDPFGITVRLTGGHAVRVDN